MGRSGIYMVINPVNEVYIGASKDLDKRAASYKYKPSTFRPIDMSLRRYGNDAHSFDILEFCDWEDLSHQENFYIQYMKFLGFTVLNVNNGSPNKENKMAVYYPDTNHRAAKIGRILKKERTKRGYSKKFVAQSCCLGVYELKEIESGCGRYSFVSLLSICIFYEIKVSLLYGMYDIEDFE